MHTESITKLLVGCLTFTFMDEFSRKCVISYWLFPSLYPVNILNPPCTKSDLESLNCRGEKDASESHLAFRE